MEIIRVLIGSMFSLLAATSILFIAYRAYTIGNEVSEMKQLLQDIRRSTLNQQSPLSELAVQSTAIEPGNWPSVTDPTYNSDLPYEIKPAESPR